MRDPRSEKYNVILVVTIASWVVTLQTQGIVHRTLRWSLHHIGSTLGKALDIGKNA